MGGAFVDVANALVGILALVVPATLWLARNEILVRVALVLTTVLAVASTTLLNLIRRKYQLVRVAPARHIADPEFFSVVTEQLVDKARAMSRELSDGSLSYTEDEVRGMNVLLFDSFSNQPQEDKLVRATALTRDPELWLARTNYLAANKRFIAGNNRVHRVFLCAMDDLVRSAFRTKLLEAISLQEDSDVKVGLAVVDLVSPELRRDYIIFGASAVVWERETVSVDFSTGSTVLHMRRDEIDRAVRVFNLLWDTSDTPGAAELLHKYRGLDAAGKTAAQIRRELERAYR